MTTDESLSNSASRSTVDDADRFYEIYECVECSNICLTVRGSPETMVCHNREMCRVTTRTIDVKSPKLEEALLAAFGLPKAGIDICMCVVDVGAASAAQIADRLDYDRSTVARYLNELVEVGMLNCRKLNRQSGGTVHVYEPPPMEHVKRETLVGFLTWAGEATTLIESANRKKEESTMDGEHERMTGPFWNE